MDFIIKFVKENKEVLSLLGTFATVLITFYYAYRARQSQKLVEKLIDSPKVVASLRRDEVNSSCLIACVENVGTGAALNVRFNPSYSFQILGEIALEDIGFLKKGIDYFGSGQKYEFLINTIMGEEAWNKLMQTPLEIKITYEDSSGEKHVENANLDFGAFEDVPLPTSPIGSIAGTAKEMVEVSKGMIRAINGIERKLNRYTRIRAGDKVRTTEELDAWTDGDLGPGTTIPKGELCTVLEVTPEDITLEWDDAPEEGGRVVCRGWRSLSEPFVLAEIKLPPKPKKD